MKYCIMNSANSSLIEERVILFDRYDNLLQLRYVNSKGKSKEYIRGYEANSYIIYKKLLGKHNSSIEKSMSKFMKEFVDEIGKSVGGEEGAKKIVEEYYKMLM